MARLSRREGANSQGYTERFLARVTAVGTAERLTEVVAKRTWEHGQMEQTCSEQSASPAVFYMDSLSLAVCSDMLLPRGPVGKPGGTILGGRELVVLHDAQAHPNLSTTHRGDYHLTLGAPQMLHSSKQAIGQDLVQRIVVDREVMSAEFLGQLQQERRQVITRLRADQYAGEELFDQVGEWQLRRSNRRGQLSCEVAAARFMLRRQDQASPAVEVEVALIRDWRKLVSE